MKVLAAGDIHGDTSLAQKLAQKAKDAGVDMVLLCGDLTYSEQSTENIIGPFAKNNQKVVLIPGNHESNATADFLAELYGATNLHGYSMKVGNVGFFGAGGANIGQFKLEEDEIYGLLEKGHESVKDSKIRVMVTHIHPKGSKIEKFSNIFPGSSGITKAISSFRPDILLCSHVHEAEGIEEIIDGTKVINVGKSGKIIDL